MKQILNKATKSVLSLLYPPLCIHCKEGLYSDIHLLCANCLDLLELIDPSERCPYCFSSSYCIENKVCGDCRKRHPIFNGLAASFDYVGPAATLIRKLKYSDQVYLAKGCGAYLAAQFLRLDWPMPDVIVPVPIAFTHWLERGYNQSLLIAESLSTLLNCPVQDALWRKSGDYSQAGLSLAQRRKLEGNNIYLRKNQKLQDKTILLIDDVMTSGSTMRKCAEALLSDCPMNIYGLAVCRAIK